MRFTFIITFKRNLSFKCLQCGRCCRGYGAGVRLELYRSDIEFLSSFARDGKFFHKEDGLYFMSFKEPEHICPFYREGICILKKDYDFFPWNCKVFPLQALEEGEAQSTFIVGINPEAEEHCPGLGKGYLVRNSLLPELIRGLVGIKLNDDPRSLPFEIALSVSEIIWL